MAAGSPSAFWYATATNSGNRHVPPNIPRRVATNIHHLRLGYRCASVLDSNDPAIVECPHCDEVIQPLFHYLLNCGGKRHLFPNPEGVAAPSLVMA